MPKPRTDKRLLMLLMITMGCSRQVQVRPVRKIAARCKSMQEEDGRRDVERTLRPYVSLR